MLLSLLVYSLTGASLFFLGWHVNRREQQQLLQGGNNLPFYSWEIILSLLLFAFIAGARYHTGFDHKMYLDQYLNLVKTGEFSRTNFEYGFEWISKLFAWCHIHYFFYFAFWAILQIGFLYFGLRNHKHLLCWVGLGIMCGPFFLGWMNSIRQSVAVCVFVSLMPFIRDRKFLPYVMIVLLCAFIHKSVLILLPVFLIGVIKIGEKAPNRWLLMGIFGAFVLVGSSPFWIDWFTNYQWFLDLTGYSNYGNQCDPNVGGTLRSVNWGISRVSILVTNVLMLYFYPEMKKYFKTDTLLPYFFIMAFIGMCLSNLLINTTHFILRPIDYFIVFYLIMDAYMMVYFIKNKKYALAILLSIVAYSHSFIDVYKMVYIPHYSYQYYLYHFFFIPTL